MPHYHSTGSLEILATVGFVAILITIGMAKSAIHDLTLPRFLSRFIRAGEDRYTYDRD